MTRLTWRKQPLPTGLARVVASQHYRPLELRLGDKVLAHVDFDRGRGAYYWYGDVGDKRHNSPWSDGAYSTPEETKEAAKAFVLAALPAPEGTKEPTS